MCGVCITYHSLGLCTKNGSTFVFIEESPLNTRTVESKCPLEDSPHHTSIFLKMDFVTGVVAQAFSPSTQEAGAGKSLSLRCKEGVPRQLGLHLSQEGKERFLQKSFKCTMNK